MQSDKKAVREKKKQKTGSGSYNRIAPMGEAYYIQIKPDTSTAYISNRAIRGPAKFAHSPLRSLG